MANDYLIVIDMQNDFVDGALGTPEAQAIVEGVVSRARDFAGTVVFTRDTHTEDYLQTQEGRNLPVTHCVRGTAGWELARPSSISRPSAPPSSRHGSWKETPSAPSTRSSLRGCAPTSAW